MLLFVHAYTRQQQLMSITYLDDDTRITRIEKGIFVHEKAK
jgi:hypothetical protein